MRCAIDAAHLARYRCTECGIALCRLCDAIVHDEPARAMHERRLLGHVAWDAAGSPSTVERLEQALCSPDDAQNVATLGPYGPQAIPGAVLHDGDSVLAALQRRLPPVRVDEATRARILERFDATLQPAPVPPPVA